MPRVVDELSGARLAAGSARLWVARLIPAQTGGVATARSEKVVFFDPATAAPPSRDIGRTGLIGRVVPVGARGRFEG